ncbi:RING finger protein [Endozoicomonas sp. 8E]|uniref:RING finger protein n=1 Tax=Endozoicomonas sp. 8E TaxID=3035692 RepID=UPI00293913D8|nr:RING finger protein [Endozoicomonas sp. 8E]WOG29219.1 RING finger protein [Endozoicomonas sp. 8E]
MAIPCPLKTLLFSVLLVFYKQGLANDSYCLEEFRQQQKINWKLPSEKQQNCTDQPAMSPFENIRIGFFRLNLASDDLSGDSRVEICENYQVAEQDFKRLQNFYFDYVGMGDAQNRKIRIQRMLRLIHHIFAININMTNGQSREEKKRISEAAKSLFIQFFISTNINDRSNPHLNYFNFVPEEHTSNYVGVDNILVLMLLSFLGPHILVKKVLCLYFSILHNVYTGQSYDQAFDSALLSKNINEYNSPQKLANQLNAAELDAETALLIGLTAMASAAFQRINSGLASLETLETMLVRCLPYEILAIVYSNLARHCRSGRSCPVPVVMYSVGGMQHFTRSIVGIYPEPVLSSESLDYLVDYIELPDTAASDGEASVEESDSEDHDPSIVIQQQNELIAQLRQELANQPATVETGAIGGATGVTKKCGVCHGPLQEVMGFKSCEHAGLCQICIERIIREQTGCPFCRVKSESYKRVFDMSSH